MKVLRSIKDIDTLKLNDSYIIQPKGFDPQNLEQLDTFSKEIHDIQQAIQDKFKHKVATIKTVSELLKMKEMDLIEYGKLVGADVNQKYSKEVNLKNIKLKTNIE